MSATLDEIAREVSAAKSRRDAAAVACREAHRHRQAADERVRDLTAAREAERSMTRAALAHHPDRPTLDEIDAKVLEAGNAFAARILEAEASAHRAADAVGPANRELALAEAALEIAFARFETADREAREDREAIDEIRREIAQRRGPIP